jgi:outer membrane autotransporter protein
MGYTRSKIDGNRFASQTKFDSWMGVLYAGHENGPWYIHGNASVGWDDCSGKRIILYPGVDRVASADFKGMDYSVYANLGYHYNATPEVRIIPNVSLHYSHLNLDGYKEKGAGDLNLKVNSQKCDFTESGVGLRM